MKPNPYHIEGPALISFSGGRTSAYMLWQAIQAHGGKLPDNWFVTFANTGMEHPNTLRFVHECATRWGVNIHWLEWRPGKPGFEEVGFNSAARDGEPFSELINRKKALPNGRQRWCTEYLKVKVMQRFMREMGYPIPTLKKPGTYVEMIGLRDDEGFRIFNGLEASERDGRKRLYPLAKNKVIKADVMRFWLGDNTSPTNLTHPLPQDFDLGLAPWDGNCRLCFLKGKEIKRYLIRKEPGVAVWWDRHEQERGRTFDKETSVRELVEQVEASPLLFDERSFEPEEYDVECGVNCVITPSMEAAE